MYRKGDGDEIKEKKWKRNLKRMEQMKQKKSDKREFLNNNR